MPEIIDFLRKEYKLCKTDVECQVINGLLSNKADRDLLLIGDMHRLNLAQYWHEHKNVTSTMSPRRKWLYMKYQESILRTRRQILLGGRI